MAAVYGSCTGSASDRYNIWLEYSLGSQSIENNTTPLSVGVYLQRNDGYANSAWNRQQLSSAYLDCTGFSQKSNSLYIDTRNSVIVTLITGSYTITHNDDGTKSISLGASFSMPGIPQLTGGSVYTTFSLPTIPRGRMRVNVGGTWRSGQAYVNVNGVWKQSTGVFMNVGGYWKRGI